MNEKLEGLQHICKVEGWDFQHHLEQICSQKQQCVNCQKMVNSKCETVARAASCPLNPKKKTNALVFQN